MTSELRAAAERAAILISAKVVGHAGDIRGSLQDWVEARIMEAFEPTKPAEPEAAKSLGEIAYFAANPPGTTYHRGWDQSSKQWWRDVAAAVEAEILRRREPQNKRLIAGRDRARVERDEWEKKFHGAMELAKTHLDSLADANVEVIGLTAELAAARSSNATLVRIVRERDAELAALKSAAVPTSDKPCLDIDGNALSVGDEVVRVNDDNDVYAVGRRDQIKHLHSNGIEIGFDGYSWLLSDRFRKVAAPVKRYVEIMSIITESVEHSHDHAVLMEIA